MKTRAKRLPGSHDTVLRFKKDGETTRYPQTTQFLVQRHDPNTKNRNDLTVIRITLRIIMEKQSMKN